jgi:hypothetical protein
VDLIRSPTVVPGSHVHRPTFRPEIQKYIYQIRDIFSILLKVVDSEVLFLCMKCMYLSRQFSYVMQSWISFIVNFQRPFFFGVLTE